MQAGKSEYLFLNYCTNPLMLVKRSEWYLETPGQDPRNSIASPGSSVCTYERVLQIETPNKYLLNEGVNEFYKYGPEEK